MCSSSMDMHTANSSSRSREYMCFDSYLVKSILDIGYLTTLSCCKKYVIKYRKYIVK